MKLKLIAIAALLFMILSPKALAEGGPAVSAQVDGKVEQGEDIQILINISNIPSFYAGQADLLYDKQVLKIKSVEAGSLISDKSINKFEALKRIDEEKGIVSYAFSCLGKINGFSGSGTFIKITAQVLKKQDFHIKSKPLMKQPDADFNLKLILCDSNVKELQYTFTPYEFKTAVPPEQGATPTPDQGNEGGTDNSGSNGDSGQVITVTPSQGGTVTPAPGDKDSGGDAGNANTGGDNGQQPNAEKPAGTNNDSELNQNKNPQNSGDEKTNIIPYLVVFLVIAGSGAAYLVYRKRKGNTDRTSNM
jgi:hypothetical protein